MFKRMKRAFSVALGYDHVEDIGQRRMSRPSHKSEDNELQPWQRTQMTSSARDLSRNFAAARFAVNTHVAATTNMEVQFRTADAGLNQEIENLLNWWFLPSNFDISGRWGFKPFIRLLEERALLDGDCGVLKLGGDYPGKLQAVEGDRIFSDCGGTTTDLSKFIHGVEVDPATSAPKNYCICKREYDGMTFERIVSAQWLELYGYFNRFDSRRGITPFSCALSPLQDSHEASKFALSKMKLSSILGFTISRKMVQDYTEATTGEGTRGPKYKINMNRGVFVQELAPGEEMNSIESNQPSMEFQQYWDKMISLSLKSLMIPFGFYQPGVSNYAELRVHSLQWLEYVKMRRDVLKQTLNNLLVWRLGIFIRSKALRLPRGLTLGSLSWDWVSPRLPWLSNYEEVQADVLNLQAGLTSPQRLCKQRGEDYMEILAEWWDYNKERESKGIAPFNFDKANIPQIQPTDEPEKKTEKK